MQARLPFGPALSCAELLDKAEVKKRLAYSYYSQGMQHGGPFGKLLEKLENILS